jgi:hypothetical protein
MPAAAARADLGTERHRAAEQVPQAVPAVGGVDVGDVHDDAGTQADVGVRPPGPPHLDAARVGAGVGQPASQARMLAGAVAALPTAGTQPIVARRMHRQDWDAMPGVGKSRGEKH